MFIYKKNLNMYIVIFIIPLLVGCGLSDAPVPTPTNTLLPPTSIEEPTVEPTAEPELALDEFAIDTMSLFGEKCINKQVIEAADLFSEEARVWTYGDYAGWVEGKENIKNWLEQECKGQNFEVFKFILCTAEGDLLTCDFKFQTESFSGGSKADAKFDGIRIMELVFRDYYYDS